MVTHYKELKVWHKAMELADIAYDITQSFPSDEKFGLSSQIRRSAVSVPSNIAEGHARNGTKEYVQFLAIAKGSLAELQTQIYIAERRKYVSENAVASAIALSEEVSKMLVAIQRTLKEKIAA